MSSLVGVEVAKAAAHAAVIKLSDMDSGGDEEIGRAIARDIGEQGISFVSVERFSFLFLFLLGGGEVIDV